MKYLKKFETEVLYKDVSSMPNHDDIKNLTMVDMTEASIKALNNHFRDTEIEFLKDISSYWTSDGLSTHIISATTFYKGGSPPRIIGDVPSKGPGKGYSRYNIEIFEYYDEWFYVSITILIYTPVEQRGWDRDHKFYSFKCDTIEGVIQLLDKYIEL